MSFGIKLRQLRKECKWTQDELGEKIGVHGRHVGKYENDQVLPNADTLMKIAKIFNASIDYLLLDNKNNTSDDIEDKELLQCFAELSQMDEKDKAVIKSLVDAYVKKRKMEEILTG